MSIKYFKKKIIFFFKNVLWDERFLEGKSKFYCALIRFLRIVSLVVQNFYRHECFSRAATLTYMTILSITPVLVIAFALLSFLAFENLTLIENYLKELFAPADSSKSNLFVETLLGVVKKININQVTFVGYFFLFLSGISLISSLENAFNRIWGVSRGRGLLRRLGSYMSILVVMPICVIFSISLSTNYQSFMAGQTSDLEKVLLQMKGSFYFLDLMLNVSSYALHHLGALLSRLLQFIFGLLFFSALYFYLPYTKVRLKESIKSGLIAAFLFELAKPIFTEYMRYLFSSSSVGKIYGALSFLPVVLLWLYIVWLIVLLGAEFAYAFQNVRMYQSELYLKRMNRRSLDILTLKMVKEILLHQQVEQYFTIEDLSQRFQLPFYFVDEMMSLLVQAQLLQEDSETGFLKVVSAKVTPFSVLWGLWNTGQNSSLAVHEAHMELEEDFEKWIHFLKNDGSRFHI